MKKHNSMMVTGAMSVMMIFVILSFSPIVSAISEWVRIYDGSEHRSDMGKDVAVDSSGNVYVVGTINGADWWWNKAIDIVVVKYDRVGDMQWVRTWDGGYSDYGMSVIIAESGNIYVMGMSDVIYSPDGNMYYELANYVIIKYDNKGNEKWSAVFGSPTQIDWPIALAVDSSDNAYITGHAYHDYYLPPSSNYSIVTLKYNSQGVMQWLSRYFPDAPCYPEAMVLDESGNVYVTGWLADASKTITIKYDTNGNKQWESSFFIDDVFDRF